MKKLPLFLVLATFGFTAHADPLQDELGNFAKAMKAAHSETPDANPATAERSAEAMDRMISAPQAPGGEAQIEAMVRQIMANNPSEDLQKAGQALLDDLAARKKARTDALKAQIDDTLARAGEVLVKAEKTEELDSVLADLQKFSTANDGGYDDGIQQQMSRVNTAYQFVAQWQDYLSARTSGNVQAAQETLRNLSNSNRQGEGLLVPRSEILARIVELTNPPKPADGSAPPAAKPAVDEGTILAGIKTPDDLEPALKALTAISPSGQTPAMQQLAQMIASYTNYQNGLPVSFNFNQQSFGFNAQTSPEIARVKAMVVLYLAPPFIGKGAPTPNPGEKISDYLDRALDETVAAQNWLAAQKVIEIRRGLDNASDNGAASSFVAGLYQEGAGQYALAAGSYQNALRTPNDAVPAKLVGDRLAAIKKDHPAEFAEGIKTIENTSSFLAMRAAMMGNSPRSPNPVGMQQARNAGPGSPSGITNAPPAALAPSPASTNAAPITAAPPAN